MKILTALWKAEEHVPRRISSHPIGDTAAVPTLYTTLLYPPTTTLVGEVLDRSDVRSVAILGYN
jgi:hypothetical protein